MPESQAAHEADANRCPVCHTSYGKDIPRPPAYSQPKLVPVVAARPPVGPEEIADGAGQAMSTGQLARKNGWDVWPSYYVDNAGSEVSLLSMARGELRAVASWERRPGSAWSADIAYGWVAGTPDTMTKLGVQRLRAVIKSVGEEKAS